jgi:hypothetical protein
VAVVVVVGLVQGLVPHASSSRAPVVCGTLVPGWACSPNTEYSVLIKGPSTEAECITACEGELMQMHVAPSVHAPARLDCVGMCPPFSRRLLSLPD